MSVGRILHWITPKRIILAWFIIVVHLNLWVVIFDWPCRVDIVDRSVVSTLSGLGYVFILINDVWIHFRVHGLWPGTIHVVFSCESTNGHHRVRLKILMIGCWAVWFVLYDSVTLVKLGVLLIMVLMRLLGSHPARIQEHICFWSQINSWTPSALPKRILPHGVHILTSRSWICGNSIVNSPSRIKHGWIILLDRGLTCARTLCLRGLLRGAKDNLSFVLRTLKNPSGLLLDVFGLFLIYFSREDLLRNRGSLNSRLARKSRV